jgi:dolichol-phosphate mannosyltransferase
MRRLTVNRAKSSTALYALVKAMKAGSSTSAATIDPPTGSLTIGPSGDDGRGLILLSVVLPTFNESKNIEEMVRRLDHVLHSSFGEAYEIIVVDDNSPDGTWDIAAALTLKYSRLRVIRRQNERGLSSAVIRGWQVAAASSWA